MNKAAGFGIATAFLAIGTFIALLKLSQPASVSVYIYSTNGTAHITSIPGMYTFEDMATVSVSMLVVGLSAAFLLLPRTSPSDLPLAQTLVDERKVRWESLSKTLKEDEVKIYRAILDAGGVMNQGDIGGKTDLSKTTVSRALDLLESKGLIEKRRRGMGNVVLLK